MHKWWLNKCVKFCVCVEIPSGCWENRKRLWGLLYFAADLAAVTLQHGLSPHQYANNTQIYDSRSPTDVHEFSLKVSECVNDVASWMRCNWLQLNPGKTELLWCSTDRRRHRQRLLPWRLALSLCHLFLPFVIWEFLSTVTWWCAHMCAALSRTALQCYVSFTASITLSLPQSSSCSSCSGPLTSGHVAISCVRLSPRNLDEMKTKQRNGKLSQLKPKKRSWCWQPARAFSGRDHMSQSVAYVCRQEI